MQRKQTKKNFTFDNIEVTHFLQEDFREIGSIDSSIESIGNDLFLKANLQEESGLELVKVEEEQKLKIEKLTPKKLKKKILFPPEKEKAEKMQKCNFDTNSLIDYAKALNSRFFNQFESSSEYSVVNNNNNNNNRNIFSEEISQSEILNFGYFSNLIEKSIEEAEEAYKRHQYLLYLGCQITPDLNAENIFSKSSLKATENEAAEKAKCNNKEKIIQKFTPNLIRPSNAICDSETSEDSYYHNSTLMNIKKEEEADLKMTTESDDENNNLPKIKVNNNKANNSSSLINANEEETKKESFINLLQQNSSSFIQSSRINSENLSNHWADINELINQFNLSREFLLNYLHAAKATCDVQYRSSDLNSFKVSSASDFVNNLQSIDFDMDNSYCKLEKDFSKEIIHFFIPTTIVLLMFSKAQNDQQDNLHNRLKKCQARWKFSIQSKQDKFCFKNTLRLDQIQINF